jgi:5-bromo-4-chloroindolyl phosphate hydrolysis protein
VPDAAKPPRRLGWRVAPQVLDVASIGGGAAVGSAAVFAGFPLAAAAGAAAVAWAALRFLVLEPLDGSTRVVADGLYENDVRQILDEGERRTAQIKTLGTKIVDAGARQTVEDIGRSLDTIFKHFEEKPADVPLAQKFLAVYLDRSLSIIRRYVEYQALTSQQAADVRAKVERELLPNLKKLCEEQYDKFLDDDLRSYDTDVEVLQKTFKLESL